MEIDLADQLAGLMVSTERIGGNPRLIKRFLNNLVIRNAIAKAQGLTIAFDQLVKLQLFERCASPAAFEYLVKSINRDDGKFQKMAEIEYALSNGEQPEITEESWKESFVTEWLKLSPMLGDKDLRPLLYLSRDKIMMLASFDELSQEARTMLEILLETKNIFQNHIMQLRTTIGETESEHILNRIMRQARANQWAPDTLIQALHVPLAHPSLGSKYVGFLREIPAMKRSPVVRQ